MIITEESFKDISYIHELCSETLESGFVIRKLEMICSPIKGLCFKVSTDQNKGKDAIFPSLKNALDYYGFIRSK